MSIAQTFECGKSKLLRHPQRAARQLGGHHHSQPCSRCNLGGEMLRWWTARHGYYRFTFCAVALGQRPHDSDVTQKALLSKSQADALQSKRKRFLVTLHRAQLLNCDSVPTHCSWNVVCLMSQVDRCHSLNLSLPGCMSTFSATRHDCLFISHCFTAVLVIFLPMLFIISYHLCPWDYEWVAQFAKYEGGQGKQMTNAILRFYNQTVLFHSKDVLVLFLNTVWRKSNISRTFSISATRPTQLNHWKNVRHMTPGNGGDKVKG